MPDDPRVMRVLKRYRKDSQYSDASVELNDVTTEALQVAFGCASDDPLYSPRELGWPQIEFFRDLLDIDLGSAEFDYYLHAYVRKESVTEYFADKARPYRVTPAPEGGPPVKAPPGKVWVPTRPKDGREHYVQVDANS